MTNTGAGFRKSSYSGPVNDNCVEVAVCTRESAPAA
jgi:uncharacterized protein DUF397